MRRFLTPRIPVAGEPVTLDAAVSHHLLRVTGIAPGETVELFDGQGGACLAALERVDDGRAVLSGLGSAPGREVDQTLWLLAAQLRPTAFDTLIRMATEMGVSRIIPVHSARVVARGDRRERWNRIAGQAAGQSGRGAVPEVSPPLSLEAAMAGVPETMRRIVCVPGAEPLVGTSEPVAVLTGPEGGFAQDEIAAAVAAGFLPAGLGLTVLRADTAGVVALSRILSAQSS
jgi:16S rRNA (uracil1498-N3)-methyltransferase